MAQSAGDVYAHIYAGTNGNAGPNRYGYAGSQPERDADAVTDAQSDPDCGDLG